MKNSNLHSLKMLAAAFASSGLLLLTGCGSSSSGGGSNPSPPITSYPPCMGTNCVYSVPQNATKGFYAQSANFPSGIFVNNGSSLQASGPVTNILEQAMGVCNRGAYNGGLADCNSWVSGYYDLVFMVNQRNPNQVTVVFRAYPVVQQNWYTYNLPSLENFFLGLIGFPVPQNPQGTFNPLILTGTINPVNNSQGFEIRAYGPQVSSGYNKLIQIQVAVGKTEDQNFNFEMFWNGDSIATGKMVRCLSATCGL